MKRVLIIGLGLAVLAGLIAWKLHGASVAREQATRAAADKFAEDFMADLERWPNEAREKASRVATDIVGFQRVVTVDIGPCPIKGQAHLTNWTGSVSADYVNLVGGVERTNLPIAFYLVNDHVLAYQGTQ